jgi:alkylation response protein AidB-like acyl-CoA dehydrogenase
MPSWSQREQALVDGAHEVATALRAVPNGKWNKTKESSVYFFNLAAQKGLTGIEVPIEQGGSAASFACKARIAEILAAADFGYSMSLINTHNVANNLSRRQDKNANDEKSDALVSQILRAEKIACTALTEPHAGSDFSAITTFAKSHPQGWCIDGEKSWIINATIADLILTYVQTQENSGAAGIAAFLIDTNRPGFLRNTQFGSDAASTLGTSSFKLTGYLARPEDLIHPAGLAFKRALHSINGARIYVAAMCCGMVTECLRIATEYGAKRQTFGAALQEHQGWRWRIADAAIDLEAARQMVQTAARALDAGDSVVDLASKAKVFATRMAEKHTASMLHAMGANGLRDEYPFVRHMTGAQIASFTDGSTEMLLERICKSQQHSH